MFETIREQIHRVEFQKVGVKDVQYPITVLHREDGTQNTIAGVNLFVTKPLFPQAGRESLMVEILNRHRGDVTLKNMPLILREMLETFKAASSHIEFTFPYFLSKKAPVTGASGMMSYTCGIFGEATPDIRIGLKVEVPITILHPDSRHPERAGSRNQRCIVRCALCFRKFIWIEDIIDIIEESASSELYSLLKRADEKHVTLKAYENPMSQEDVVSSVSEKLAADENVLWFSVSSESIESLHNHNNYASVIWTRPGADRAPEG